MIEAFGIKEDGKTFRIVNRALLDQELTELPKGRYRLKIEKYRRNKSLSQLGYLFACVYPLVLKALNDAGWEFTSIDEVDEYCKSMFASKDILNRNTGEILEIPALKRNMTTTEFSTYVNAIRDWCSEYLNAYIPEPLEQTVMEFSE
jgi:hypothetical protein